MGIILFIFIPIIVLWGYRRARAARWRPPVHEDLISEGEVFTIACPHCGTTRRATEIKIERSTPGQHGRPLPPLSIYRCDTCQTEFNPAACVDDGSGILAVAAWRCALCQEMNEPTTSKCSHCGAGGETAA
jgi:predicted RNA-binding Zn-ribbon protein involved in translation (DUF1610 family)